MTRRAAIYARVSTDRQAETGTSLDTQVERCSAHAAAQGWTVVDRYVDRGESGAKASRPELDRLLAAVRAGKVDVVVCAALDRIGRSAAHLVGLFAELDKAGVTIVSLRESIDSGTPTGRLVRTLLVALAELERDLIRERTGHGRLAAARSGRWVSGSLPWGLTTDDDGEIVVDPAAKVVIERIVALLVDDGLSPWQAAPALNDEGHRTPRGSRWTPDGLRTLLRRITDTDRWAGRIETRVDDQLGLPPVSIEVPRVLDPERLAALRTALDGAGQAKTRKPRIGTYPLSGRVTMPCGGHLTGIWRHDRQTRTYRCSNYPARPESPSCDCPTIDCDVLESRVWALIRDQFTASDIDDLTGQATAVSSERVTATVESSTTLAARITRFEQAAGRQAAELLAAGADPAIVQAAVAELTDKLAATRRRHQQTLAWEQAANAERMTGEWIVASRDRITDWLANPTLDDMAELAQLLDVSVTITGWRPSDDPVLGVRTWMPQTEAAGGSIDVTA